MSSTTYALNGAIASRVKPCLDFVFIEKLTDERSKGGIILVEHKDNSVPTERGRILAVGEGRWEAGIFIKVELKVGAEILFQSYPAGCDLKENGKQYTLISARQVSAVLA